MLKTRIIPTLLYRDAGLVKGRGFASDRPVGGAMQSVKVYNLREVDELVFLDVTATIEGRGPDLRLIDELADHCFMPLAVGGGVRTIQDFRDLLSVGADKVVVNSAALADPGLIDAAAAQYGSQCVVVAIDARGSAETGWVVHGRSGREPTALDPVSWAIEVERRGAGEIILTNIDRDGTMTGYDVPLVAAVSAAVGIPVIASGGAGSYADMLAGIRAGASAVAAAAMFHFTQQTPREAKLFLRENGVPVRLTAVA